MAWIFFGITQLGDGIFVIFLCLILFFNSIKNSFIILMSYLFSSVISRVLKDLVFVNQYRPVKYFGDFGITFKHLETVELYSFHSFPSGHTITAFAVFGALSFLFKTRKTQSILGITAVLVAISRVYLGQHFVRDVAFGAFLGLLSTILLMKVLQIDKISNWLNEKMSFRLTKRFSKEKTTV
ncbi:MAG: phosphatase PAP2 family protein [Cytophagales bacterium]